MSTNIEQEYKQVQANLKEVNDNLKAFAEESQKQIKNFGAMNEETKASVDKLLVTQGELNARIQAAEQALAENKGGNDARVVQSLGQQVVGSEDFKANVNRLIRGTGSISINAAITEAANSAGALVEPERVGLVALPQRQLTVRDLLRWGRTKSNSIEYPRQKTFTNNAAVVGENPSGGKPQSSMDFELVSAPVATIAHWIPASKQVLDDVAMLQSFIDGQLRYGLKLEEEEQLLKGSGSGLNLNGIYTQATQYANPGVTVTDETALDRLRLALLQVALSDYEADGILLNPADWAAIELIKDKNANYIIGNPHGSAIKTLWGRNVVTTKALDATEFLVGAFAIGAQGWDREDVSVVISTEDRDNFIKNMVTIRCEERVGLSVYRPAAFVKGDLTVS